MTISVQVLPDPHAVAVAAAGTLQSLETNRAPSGPAHLLQRRSHTVVFPGGSTPLPFFRHLAREHPELQKARDDDSDAEDTEAYGPLWLYSHVFFTDERAVPPTDPRSNFGTALRECLAPLRFPESRLHRMSADAEHLEEAAQAYEHDIHRTFARIWEEQSRVASLIPFGGDLERTIAPDPDAWQRFDLVFLGLGEDGHTASLFPGSPALDEKQHWVVATQHPQTGEARMTLTLPCLNRARNIVFLVTGTSKAEALRRVLHPDPGAPTLPAGRVCPHDGTVTWLVDETAAAALPT